MVAWSDTEAKGQDRARLAFLFLASPVQQEINGTPPPHTPFYMRITAEIEESIPLDENNNNNNKHF